MLMHSVPYNRNKVLIIYRSNNYQTQESETWIREWMKLRNCRVQMVIATKFTFPYCMGDTNAILSNAAGNSAKSLYLSVQASLPKLQTTYIDLVRSSKILRENSTHGRIALCTSLGLYHIDSGTYAVTQ
jgi:aryl-alcohol dehydrogenase-like predicted oxidoreductase